MKFFSLLMATYSSTSKSSSRFEPAMLYSILAAIALFLLIIFTVAGIKAKKSGKLNVKRNNSMIGDIIDDDDAIVGGVITNFGGYYRWQEDNQKVIDRDDVQKRIVDEYFIVKFGDNKVFKILKILAFLAFIPAFIFGIINVSYGLIVFGVVLLIAGMVFASLHKKSRSIPVNLMSHKEYENIVERKIKSMDIPKMGLIRLGIDEEQVKEIAPIFITNQVVEARSLQAYDSQKRKLHSSTRNAMVVYFGNNQVYLYKLTFDMCCNEIRECTSEFFYKDICDVSSLIEKNVLLIDEDMVEYSTMEVKVVSSNSSMSLRIDGTNEKFDGENEHVRSIRGMIQKIREKKNK